MKFEKGHKGYKPVGAKSERIKQWEALGEAITTTQAQQFNEFLFDLWQSDEVKDKIMAAELYLKALEYFRPKLQRTEHSGEVTTKETVIFKIAGQEIPFQSVN